MLRLPNRFAREPAEKRIKIRILGTLVIGLGMLLAIFSLVVWNNQQKEQANDARLSAQNVERLLSLEENQKVAVLKTTIQAIMNDGRLAEAFRKRDRAALIERAKPLFDSLRNEHGISHFYFHLPDRTVLLRMHDYTASGDKINRYTMLEAERTGKVSVGIERGLTGIFTLRVVSPWWQDGQLLGYLELGVEFQTIVQDIHKQLNNNLDFVVAVDKKFLDRAQWANARKRDGIKDDWDQFAQMIVINKTMQTLPQLAIDRLSTESGAKDLERRGDLLLVHLPLTDLDGKDIGAVIVLQNVADEVEATDRAIQLVIGVGLLLGSVVIVFFYFFLTRIENNLLERTAKLKDEISERKRTEKTLHESDEKFRQMAENITDMFWMTSPDMRQVLYVSPAYEVIWGHTAESLYAHPSQWAEAIPPEDRDRVFTLFSTLGTGISSASTEFQISRPDGEMRWIYGRGFPVRDAAGRVIRLTGIATDITERRKIETRMLQSQKTETVGKLAGGIAHEFNSILTAIIGQSELLLSDLPIGSPLGESAREIHQAGERAAILTRQLLAYGRKQILQPEILDLNRLLTDMLNTLQHLMGREVDIRIVPGLNLKTVKIDPGQMEQVLVNIAMNAADAMPNGGQFTLETANVTLDEEYVRPIPGLVAGGYVMLAMTDTGIGMSEEIRTRVFEPFFSTKSVGEGTGLGLATCHGILKQSDGHLEVYSEVARGTTFKIYLPQVEQQPKSVVPRVKSGDLPQGTETILLAEDDPSLLKMSSTLLRRLGYTVLTAANGIEALNLKNQRNVGHIDLLLTDVVMPHMSGKELSDRIQAIYPRTKILFTSAYAESAIVHQGILNKGVMLLQKPFTPSALANKVREVLDEPSKPATDWHGGNSFVPTQNISAG